MSEDLTRDEDLVSVERFETKKAGAAILGNGYTFQGEPLWPYTLGTRVMFNQVIDRKDKMLFVWAAFVFLLIRRGEPTASEDRKKHLLTLWDSGDMRGAILDWIDGLTEADLIEAQSIYDKWMKADQATAVEPVPAEGLRTEKKTRRKKQP